MRMHPALKQQLVPAQHAHLVNFLHVLFHAGDVAGFVVNRLIEVTEFASRNTGVCNVHIAVNYPGDFILRMKFLADLIPEPHQTGKRKFAEQFLSLVDSK